MTSSLDLIRGRQVVQTLTNQSGGAVIAGDVVIIDTANDESFTTTTSAAYNATQVCISLDTIAANATGRILLQGYAPLVNVSASATRGYYLLTHTVAKQATSGAAFATGAFGQVLKAGTSPSAYIFPPAIGSSAGITRSGATTDAHYAVWNGSSADSLKDGGAALSTPALTRIAQTVVGVGGVASVTFSTIPGTYENLILTVTGRGSKTANNSDVYVQFNADTGNNYDTEYTNHQSTAMSSGEIRAGSGLYVGSLPAASATANFAGAIRVNIIGYARSVFNKVALTHDYTVWGTGASSHNEMLNAGQWRNTAAITAIKVYPDANDFVQDTVLTLYGES